MPWGAVVGAVIGAGSSAIQGRNNRRAAEAGQAQPLTPWEQAPPHLQSLNQEQYNLAMQNYLQPFTQGRQGVAGFNPDQNQAFGMMRNAAGGSPTQTAGQDAMMRGASGNANIMFGMDNPYTTKAIDATTSDMQRQFNKTTAPMLDAMNTRANTGFGTSSAVDEMRTDAYQGLNDQMAQVSNDMRYKDLNAQQHMGEGMAARQLQAAGMAPAMQGMQYNNINALLGVGNQQQLNQQAGLDSQYQEFLRQMNYPKEQMAMMSAPFGSLQGGTVMMPGQENVSPNYLNAALGGATAGMGLYNQFRQNPYQMSTTTDGNMYGNEASQWWGGDGVGW